MKRLLPLLLILSLAGCAAPDPLPDNMSAVEAMSAVPEPSDALATGIAMAATVSKSMHATYDFPGAGRTDLTVAAVLVDSSGIIRQCAIDGISASLPFDATGALQTEAGTRFPSKCALGQDYGMHKASPLGTEWCQQAAEVSAWAVGKTAAELRAGDVVASVTISTDQLLQAVCDAADNASCQGARTGDELVLVCFGVMDPSQSACIDDGTPGLACFRAAAGAFTLRQGTVTSRAFDGLTSAVTFTAAGRIDCNLSVALSALSDVLCPAAPGPEMCAELEEMATT